jgi:SpoVK/Ycf46/Vps4 family AAA+-type ATPase
VPLLQMSGSRAFTLAPGRVTLRVERIDRRAAAGPSGTLAVRLWALPQPFAGGVPRGHVVATTRLPRLTAGGAVDNLSVTVPCNEELPCGYYYALLTLDEYDDTAPGQWATADLYPFDQRTFFGRRVALRQVSAGWEGDSRLRIDIAEVRNQTNDLATVSVAGWLTREPYQGGSLKGTRLGTLEIGAVDGGECRRRVTWSVDVPTGRGEHLAILLLEGGAPDAASWQLRDYLALDLPAAGATAAVPVSEDVIHESDLIGQERAKAALHRVIAVARLNEERRRRGVPATGVNFHSAFIGSPGTGKTTFARFYTQQIRGLGMLARGHLVEVSRRDLVAAYVGQTAEKTTKVVESALGGVLFIDEAYALKNGPDDTFGQECIDTLVKQMEDHRDDVVIIFAGYSVEMREFLRQNSGLESRVPHVVEFEDFDDDALGRILDTFCRQRGVTLAPGVRPYAIEHVAAGRRGRSFGNARDVRNLVERAVANQSLRLTRRDDVQALSPEELSELWYSDFLLAAGEERREPPPRRTGAEGALGTLRGLVGLAGVKSDVEQVVGMVRVERARRPGQALSAISLHRLYAGPPGCGKRTVAGLLGTILVDLGLLARGHLVEASRADFVAGYIGQTALKTRARVEEAMGGILFVHDAASLWQQRGGFEMEAVDELLRAADTCRDRLVIILSGDPHSLEAVSGLDARLKDLFRPPLVFDTPTVEELLDIGARLAAARGLRLADDARVRLRLQLEVARSQNAAIATRDVKLALDQAYRRHAVRLHQLGDPASLAGDLLHVLEADDFGVAAAV